MGDFEFSDSSYYTGPLLTEELIAGAERRLGRRLPSSYLRLLHVRNGGVPQKRKFRTGFQTSWADGYFEIAAIRGLGGRWGIDTEGPLSSASMVSEWGYPSIGVVICDMPSGGHDAVMLDYRHATDEPAVAYIDEDRVPRVIADTFANFLATLETA